MRLADPLVGLSRFADLGFGLQSGTALRACALSLRLARSLDLAEADAQAAFYTSLLHHVGCVGYAHETARLFGDEIAANLAAARTDTASTRDLMTTWLPALTQDKPPLERARVMMNAAVHGSRWGLEFTTTACEVGRDTAQRLGLSDRVQESLFHVYDLWRGKGPPGSLAGDDIPIGARIARLTGIASLFASIGDDTVTIEAVGRRAGGMLDPVLVERFIDDAAEWLSETVADPSAEVLDVEPVPHATVHDLRVVAEVFGDLADLKSPHFVGHSRAVATLATKAADRLRLSDAARADLELAGLLHDIGRVAVSDAVWDKTGPLTADAWEQVRLHPYHSERILTASPSLTRLASLVGRHHERLDGSGYHRGSTAQDIALPARVLAAADAYQTALEPRPHRPALRPELAERRLRALVEAGRLDADAVHAVLGAGGRPVPTSAPSHPRGLSGREVEVLGLVARGCSNAEIASRLVISRRTAEHHVQHVYTKIGVSSRAAVTLYAVRHNLLDLDG